MVATSPQNLCNVNKIDHSIRAPKSSHLWRLISFLLSTPEFVVVINEQISPCDFVQLTVSSRINVNALISEQNPLF